MIPSACALVQLLRTHPFTALWSSSKATFLRNMAFAAASTRLAMSAGRCVIISMRKPRMRPRFTIRAIWSSAPDAPSTVFTSGANSSASSTTR